GGDQLLGISGGVSRLGRDREPPDVRVLTQDGEGDAAPVRRDGRVEVLAGSVGDLLRAARGAPIRLQGDSPKVQPSAPQGGEPNEATRRGDDGGDVLEEIVRDPGRLAG